MKYTTDNILKIEIWKISELPEQNDLEFFMDGRLQSGRVEVMEEFKYKDENCKTDALLD